MEKNSLLSASRHEIHQLIIQYVNFEMRNIANKLFFSELTLNFKPGRLYSLESNTVHPPISHNFMPKKKLGINRVLGTNRGVTNRRMHCISISAFKF